MTNRLPFATARIVLWALFASSAIACAAIPDITFIDDAGSVFSDGGPPPFVAEGGVANSPIVATPPADGDAGAPSSGSGGGTSGSSGSVGGGTPTGDAGMQPRGPSSGGMTPPGGPPGMSSSGGPSGPGSSSGGIGVCPLGAPAGATVCCGAIACVGKKCASNCGECSVCVLGQTCCMPNGNGQAATCSATPADCPSEDQQ